MTIDELRPHPKAAAWTQNGDDRAVVRWVAEQSSQPEYARRALFIERSGDLGNLDAAVRQFGSNKNIGSARSHSVTRGGAVLACRIGVKLLGSAVSAADGQVFGVVEHAEGEMAGWAAATGAIDVASGEPTTGVPDEIHEALVDLEQAGYNGYHRDREPYFAALYFRPIDLLLEAGYSYKFVASYLVALGAFGEKVGDPLKRIYVPSDQRRRVSRR